jgi:hypothetical protein
MAIQTTFYRRQDFTYLDRSSHCMAMTLRITCVVTTDIVWYSVIRVLRHDFLAQPMWLNVALAG